jgi:regulation of enolase protein 1 (concanavalin A-like superfamily)
MKNYILNETFSQDSMDPQLNWLNAPQQYYQDTQEKCLVIAQEAHTDFWQKTHYNFTPDNGHFLYREVTGDFILSTKVRFYPKHQYDQAGLLVRISAACWLKTSVEYEPDGASRLGVVVTNSGYSDWSTQEFLSDKNEITLRVRRENGDYLVEYLKEDISWVQMRMAHLLEDTGAIAVKAGLYACSPAGAGYKACFDFLQIQPGRTV